jgi:predicted transcriptional regulator
MQLNIDIDNIFAEELKKEFSTSNLKDAIYKLFEFYQNTQKINTQEIEIIKEDDSDYNYIVDARKKRENGEKTFSLDDVIEEFK